MGCGRSFFQVGDHEVYFSEGDDAVGCLCTFHKDRDVDAYDVLSLALLGAAVRFTKDGASGSVTRCVPQEMQDNIAAILGMVKDEHGTYKLTTEETSNA